MCVTLHDINNKLEKHVEIVFVNAQLLRAPFPRIFGILQVLEMEKSTNFELKKIGAIKKYTDQVILKINEVTSSSSA